jgi:hypothetical protein
MDTKVLRLIVGGILPAVGIAIITLLACDTRNAIKPNPLVVSVGSVQIVLNPEYIRLSSSEAIDTVQILITVLDSLGVGMPDIDVAATRTPEIGYLSQPDSTDDQGQTSAYYITEPGIFNNVWIDVIAKNKTDSALLVINSASSAIARIVVSPHEDEQVVDGSDSTSINITVTDSTGNPVIDGTVVYLSQTGEGMLWMPELITINGQARGKIDGPPILSPASRIDSVFVCDFPGDSASVADTMIIHYLAGPVANLDFVYPESTVTLIAGSGDTCSVWVLASDINGNPMTDGTQISFRNFLSGYSSLTPSNTFTLNGIAKSIYLVGSGTGDDNVTAWALNPANPNDTIWTAHPVVFRCIASGVTNLELSTTDDSIPVGGSSTLVIATIDGEPSPFEGPLIAFDILDSTSGTSFDSLQQVQHDTVPTNINNRAIVQLFSGHRAGTVSIRACTVPEPPDSFYVCDERALVAITPGPPEHMSFAFSSNGEVEPPAHFAQLGALVFDRYSNPVEYGTPVHFSLLPDDLANIDLLSYTGANKPYHEDSTEGVAYTRILYGHNVTFHLIQVVASAGDPITITDTSALYELPIYGGQISLLPNPGILYAVDSTCDSRDTSWITARLFADCGAPVQYGIIEFSAPVVGTIIGNAIDTTNSNGDAVAKFMIRGCDIPCQDSECTITATVKATLVQKPSVWSVVEIPCSRPLIRMR